MTEQTDEQSNRLLFFGEPSPQSVGPLAAYLQGRAVQKMLIMSPVEHSDQIRPHLVTALGGRAEITEAIRGMLEVCSAPHLHHQLNREGIPSIQL